MYIVLNKKGPFFFADTTVNVNPTTEELVDIIGLTAILGSFVWHYTPGGGAFVF